MKKIIIVLSAIVIIALGSKATAVNSEIKKEADYEISIGETLEIKLATTPSTGYSWSWVNKDSVTVVDSIGRSYLKNESTLIGSGGTDIWTFVGVNAGEETIIFEYAPGWKRQNVGSTKNIIIKVNE